MSLWFIVGVIVAVVVVIVVLAVVIVICCRKDREGVQTEEEQASLWGSGEATGGRTRALW